jgi:hypothetical protein
MWDRSTFGGGREEHCLRETVLFHKICKIVHSKLSIKIISNDFLENLQFISYSSDITRQLTYNAYIEMLPGCNPGFPNLLRIL